MVNDQDRKWFDNELRTIISKMFKTNPHEALGDDVIMFGDFMDVGADVREYTEITDWDKVEEVLTDYLDDYNSQTTKPMKLVLFMDAISHITRISRILRQPLGNSLLLGMAGTGT